MYQMIGTLPDVAFAAKNVQSFANIPPKNMGCGETFIQICPRDNRLW